ncbi:hypothetical protein GT360_00325 [Vibrio astriarenae]|uniref:Uncharacterized protein n=1 Tax=Vibrio astriarenae TaxID=1481923 RepID=A0A7Z2T0G5_9VIBR|nr:hypothetical protein [Vibrio astriarenae]QIA62094.1 hypothetical protein GT360_00325 [Vibrio astriarenae]
MTYVDSGSVTPKKSHIILLPIEYGYTPKFLTIEEKTFLLSELSNPKFKTLVSAVHDEPGIQSDALTDLTGVTNIAQYRVRLNKQLQKFGLELKPFKALGISRSADFFHWYFVEYTPLPNQTIQQLKFDGEAANDDTLQ